MTNDRQPVADRQWQTGLTEQPIGQTSPSVELHIDALVLCGFAAPDRFVIGEALTHEITRQLSEQGLPTQWNQDSQAYSINASNIQLSAHTPPAMVGVQVAQAVCNALKPER